MSTDDLVRRARAWARELNPADPGASSILSEVASEVDRLTSANVTLRTVRDRLSADVASLTAERDAARAALERVRGVVGSAELAAPLGKPPYWTSHILNALEGES